MILRLPNFLKLVVVTGILLTVFDLPAFPQTIFKSGPDQVALVELFTSEGCSSCPPADQRMSEFLKDPNVWIVFVPVSFHVDYWNGLGWKDRFSNEEFTERQRRYARSWGSGSIYTPNFVLNGTEWKNWYQSGMFQSRKTNSPGTLEVQIVDGQATARFTPSQNSKSSFKSCFAILGFDVESEIQHGENSGKKLKHNFIVLNYQEKPFQFQPTEEIWLSKIAIPTVRERVSQKGIAVWVGEDRSQIPIQAAGGLID